MKGVVSHYGHQPLLVSRERGILQVIYSVRAVVDRLAEAIGVLGVYWYSSSILFDRWRFSVCAPDSVNGLGTGEKLFFRQRSSNKLKRYRSAIVYLRVITSVIPLVQIVYRLIGRVAEIDRLVDFGHGKNHGGIVKEVPLTEIPTIAGITSQWVSCKAVTNPSR